MEQNAKIFQILHKTLCRLAIYAGYEEEIFICAMIYLDKLLKYTTDEAQNPFKKSLKLRKSLSACVFLAGKMHSGATDKIKLVDFSKIVNIPVSELYTMESLLCNDILKWKLNIDSEYFRCYKNQLESLF
jgi:hypothetical protein